MKKKIENKFTYHLWIFFQKTKVQKFHRKIFFLKVHSRINFHFNILVMETWSRFGRPEGKKRKERKKGKKKEIFPFHFLLFDRSIDDFQIINNF